MINEEKLNNGYLVSQRTTATYDLNRNFHFGHNTRKPVLGWFPTGPTINLAVQYTPPVHAHVHAPGQHGDINL